MLKAKNALGLLGLSALRYLFVETVVEPFRNFFRTGSFTVEELTPRELEIRQSRRERRKSEMSGVRISVSKDGSANSTRGGGEYSPTPKFAATGLYTSSSPKRNGLESNGSFDTQDTFGTATTNKSIKVSKQALPFLKK